jgi:cephalosporin-C deacetylase-like acetyl esterase
VIVKVGVKLGTIVGVAEGAGMIVLVRVAVKAMVGLIDTVCAPIEPFGQ